MICRLILIKKLKSMLKKSGFWMYDTQGNYFSKYSFKLDTNIEPLYRFNITINWREKTIELHELNYNWFKKGVFGAGMVVSEQKKIFSSNIKENIINDMRDYLQSYILICKLSNK